MRRLLSLLLLGGACLFSSCEQMPTDTQQDEYITVRFSLNANFSESDSPLETKGDTEHTYVVEAYQYNPNVSYYESYARGIFDSSENIAINLISGRQYSFRVAYFKDFFNSGWLLNGYEDFYSAANNEFIYDNIAFYQLKGGASCPFYYGLPTSAAYASINCESFFGTVEDYTAVANGSINVSLSRTASFLEVQTTGLTEGRIVASEGYHFTIEYPNTSYSGWITDNRFVSGGDSFTIPITFRYYPPNVDNEANSTLLLRQEFTFKRNYKKTVTINITPATPTETSNGVSFTISDADLQIDESEEFDCVL